MSTTARNYKRLERACRKATFRGLPLVEWSPEQWRTPEEQRRVQERWIIRQLAHEAGRVLGVQFRVVGGSLVAVSDVCAGLALTDDVALAYAGRDTNRPAPPTVSVAVVYGGKDFATNDADYHDQARPIVHAFLESVVDAEKRSRGDA